MYNVARTDYGRVLSSLIRRVNHIQLAEDGLQDALTKAVTAWTHGGIPRSPSVWIYRVALNRCIDMLRRQSRFAHEALPEAILEDTDASREGDQGEVDFVDDRLRLVFTCCHPALAEEVRVALTLRTLCGLTTAQIAQAFLVSESAMAQRLVRAKRKIQNAGIPYEIPRTTDLDDRLDGVLSVIYLIFNEGYFSSSVQALIETSLCDEALFLGKMLAKLMPHKAEVWGLLALMFFHRSRFEARVGSAGELIDMQHQNRSLWNQADIQQGDRLLKGALMKGDIGTYQIQAAISGVHAHATAFEQTDWQQIVLLYEKLMQYDNRILVSINQAVALSYAIDVNAGLKQIHKIPIDASVRNYMPLQVALADMNFRAGNTSLAIAHYDQAIELCKNLVEKTYLEGKRNNIVSSLVSALD